MKPLRTAWNALPDVLILAGETAVKQHPDYVAAKRGDELAAAQLVHDLLSSAAISQITERWSAQQPTLVSAHAEEADGRNAIPQALAAYLGECLRWEVDDTIVQINIVNHTGASGFARLARPALFGGQVTAGHRYLLVDDFVGQGGTLANLRGFIESNGGLVVGAIALTGKSYSAKLALSPARLKSLRTKHGQLESWWSERFGYHFDALTESEARYLERTEDADTIRDRLVAEEQGHRSSSGP